MRFREQVLREIRLYGIQTMMEDILTVVMDEVQNLHPTTQKEWYLIASMLEGIIDGPIQRLQHSQAYGNAVTVWPLMGKVSEAPLEVECTCDEMCTGSGCDPQGHHEGCQRFLL